MKKLLRFFPLFIAATIIAGCRDGAPQAAGTENAAKRSAVYYWKTVFEIDSTEVSFLQKQDIDRIYLRMFDVATEPDFLNGECNIVPIATTRFVSPIPTDIEIVPVTYITIEALRAMKGREEEIASLITERLLAMASYNRCGKINEIQFDCDWTGNTKESYSRLCKTVQDTLHSKGIELSITVRLHQLPEVPPPADRGVLMLYNTGALKNPETANSILHYNDVKSYIRPYRYPIPLDYAYPLFGWGVKFKNNRFVSIVPFDCKKITDNEHIRYERPSTYKILQVKELVEHNLGKPARGSILYHLDHSQLKNYDNNEIAKILAY